MRLLLGVGKTARQRDQQRFQRQPHDADHENGDDDVLDLQVVPFVHSQKPMPVPPVSISAATITSQAVPMDNRTPVST